jgi:hypothetical protein
VLHAFDLIELDGADLRDLPLLERKRRLARLLERKRRAIRFVEHLTDDGPTVFAHACRMGLEGIVSKRVAAPYRGGASKVWLKLRTRRARPCAASARRSGVDARRGGAKGAAPLPRRARAVGGWRPGGSDVDLKAKVRAGATVGYRAGLEQVDELRRGLKRRFLRSGSHPSAHLRRCG